MRIISWLLGSVVFLLLLAFASKNMDTVAVRYFLGLEWQAPLVFVMLVCLIIGVASGVMASLAIIGRQKREMLALKRELRGYARAAPARGAATAESL